MCLSLVVVLVEDYDSKNIIVIVIIGVYTLKGEKKFQISKFFIFLFLFLSAKKEKNKKIKK